MKRFFSSVLRLLASHGLACVLFLLLGVLTYVGTIEQARVGLYEAQRRYFGSWLAVWPLRLGGDGSAAELPIALPGAMTLMTLFAVNLFLGGVARMRRGWDGLGLLVVHGGVLFLLVGGLVTHYAAQTGLMTLEEGQASSRFESDRQWELAIVEPSPAAGQREWIVPWKSLLGKSLLAQAGAKANAPAEGRKLAIQGANPPFDMLAGRFDANARVFPASATHGAPATATAIDGEFVHPMPPSASPGADLPAITVTLIDAKPGADKRSGARAQKILWGGQAGPVKVQFAGRAFELSLRRRAWRLPFSIRLNKFTREFHPGTTQPKRFESDVTKLESGGARRAVIRMNEPLRTEGYALFQASYSEDPETGRLSSTLAVSRNPADQFPLYACVVITAGMLLHFGASLFGALKRERGGAK